jgi:hypothetical protein
VRAVAPPSLVIVEILGQCCALLGNERGVGYKNHHLCLHPPTSIQDLSAQPIKQHGTHGFKLSYNPCPVNNQFEREVAPPA